MAFKEKVAGEMPGLGDIDSYERRIRASIVNLNHRKITGVTLVEAIDHAEIWPGSFEAEQPFVVGHTVSALLDRAPLYMCCIASEIGFRFEGVGTEFWNKLVQALGVPITMTDRTKFGDVFSVVAKKYGLSQPSESAFTAHFSIISWPIANALLPVDLLGPVARLLAQAPVTALPGAGRSAHLPSLRAWASAVEGARLTDWLRFEAASERVLVALLTENRSGGVSGPSYARLHDAISRSSESFFAIRAARQRARRTKASAATKQTLGRLTVVRDATGLKLYATWPTFPGELVDEAKVVARAAGWRPQLWGEGAHLHSDTALGEGPFALLVAHVPRSEQTTYGDVESIFGEGSAIASALAGRIIEWNETLLFDVNDNRTRGEQRFSPFNVTTGRAWLASCAESTELDRLRLLGTLAGYQFFEADLGSDADRAILTREGYFATKDRTFAARHPIDSITAPQGVVRPGRPFLVYRLGPPLALEEPQRLTDGDRTSYTIGASEQSRLRCEALLESDLTPVMLSLLERDAAFSALVERRLQLRVESAHALRNVRITAELEIHGTLIVRSVAEVAEVPATIDQNSALLRPLYVDAIRARLLESGAATLRFAIGGLACIEIPLTRPTGTVDWSTYPPKLLHAEADVEMVCAAATAPNRFAPADDLVAPARGATGYVLRYLDGHMADPMNLLASSRFDLGDFAANFDGELGSRRLRHGGRGTGELARARIAWSRAQCGTLQALAAKTRVVQQFEDPLVYNLCGREWSDLEHGGRATRSDPHEALYLVALEQGLATLPDAAAGHYKDEFAKAFAVHARRLDPEWPLARPAPLVGTMDDALNLGFADAVDALQRRGALAGVDPDNCDFGSPEEMWTVAVEEALRRIRRAQLAGLIAPSEGGRRLLCRFYTHTGISEMAEDLAAWTRVFALPRGLLTAETAASALQLWLSPAACGSLDAAVRVLINDPFVARATRYAAIRMQATSANLPS